MKCYCGWPWASPGLLKQSKLIALAFMISTSGSFHSFNFRICHSVLVGEAVVVALDL